MKDTDKKALINRLRSARGHVDAVMRMVEDDTYCVDVMKQLSAVQGSLEAASRTVLRNHLKTCVAEAMRSGRMMEIVDELSRPGASTASPPARGRAANEEGKTGRRWPLTTTGAPTSAVST